MARNEKSRKKNNSYRPNVWGFLSQVFYQAMNKGQLIPLIIGLGFLIVLVRIPPEGLVKLFEKVIISFENYRNLGWLIAFISTISSFFIVKKLRQTHTFEIKRLAEEKKKLQQLNSKIPISSSNKR